MVKISASASSPLTRPEWLGDCVLIEGHLLIVGVLSSRNRI